MIVGIPTNWLFATCNRLSIFPLQIIYNIQYTIIVLVLLAIIAYFSITSMTGYIWSCWESPNLTILLGFYSLNCLHHKMCSIYYIQTRTRSVLKAYKCLLIAWTNSAIWTLSLSVPHLWRVTHTFVTTIGIIIFLQTISLSLSLLSLGNNLEILVFFRDLSLL